MILLGLVTGLVAALVWYYAMQPKILYPQWLLTTFDHPWMLLVFAFFIIYISLYVNATIGAMLFLIFVALVLDIIAFAQPKSDVVGIESEVDDIVDGIPAPDVGYSMFYGLNDLQPGDPAAF